MAESPREKGVPAEAAVVLCSRLGTRTRLKPREMDAAIAAALHRKANPPGNRDFTDNLLKALNEVAEQGTPSSWAPKPKNPMLPESDVESIAGLPPGDTPRSAWLGGGGRFDSIRTLPGEDEEEGSEAEAAQIEEPSRRAGSGGGEVAAGALAELWKREAFHFPVLGPRTCGAGRAPRVTHA